ncbi:MAG: UPF0175 family protein [bacterium]
MKMVNLEVSLPKELLGMRKRGFRELLDGEEIPFFDYTKKELEEEFKTVALLVKI